MVLFLPMDKLVREKPIQFLEMMKIKVFCQDLLNLFSSKFSKNREILIYNLKFNVHFWKFTMNKFWIF